jgi:hypothetical protein
MTAARAGAATGRRAGRRAVALKPQYGPTLGQLLSPSWRTAPRAARAAVIVGAVALAALVAGAVFTLENARFSHAGRVPFGFSYRSLYRTTPDPGGYVKVQRRAHGLLQDSFAVGPLRLPPYSGGLSGEVPLYAAGYVRALSRRDSGFVLRGEGKTRVNTVPAYEVLYTATVAGRKMYGRDVLLLPERPGAREGVDIVMLSAPSANSQVSSPLEVASTGVLLRPLKTFTFR